MALELPTQLRCKNDRAHVMRSSPPSLSLPMVFALAAGLVLIAVPLHLWRSAARPPEPDVEQGTAPELRTLEPGLLREATPSVELIRAVTAPSLVKLARFKTLRCVKSGPGKTPPERCDHVELFEDALAQAIRDHADIGPSRPRGAVVSFVMDIDFRRRRVKVFRGKSSTVPKRATKELFRRVSEGMPEPPWYSIRHEHYRYVVYVKATYPPSQTF